MEIDSPVYRATFERIIDTFSRRYPDTFTRQEISDLVHQGRTGMEGTSHHPEFIPALVERWTRDRLAALALQRGSAARQRPVLLFVCEHNEGRSQMAAAIAEHLAGDQVAVLAAGVSPTGHLSPETASVLAERGVSLEGRYSSGLHEDILDAADALVLMGVKDYERTGRRILRWDVTDPYGESVEVQREVRDDIADRVRELLVDMDVEILRELDEPTPTDRTTDVADDEARAWGESRRIRVPI